MFENDFPHFSDISKLQICIKKNEKFWFTNLVSYDKTLYKTFILIYFFFFFFKILNFHLMFHLMKKLKKKKHFMLKKIQELR